MKRALVIHGDIYGFGGAENFAIKLIRTLTDCGVDVTLLHAGGALDVSRIRDRMGIELDPTKTRFVQADAFRWLPRAVAGSLLLSYAFVLRQGRRMAPYYDFVVGTYGETPIAGARVIQTVHIPLFFHDPESLRYLGMRSPTRRQMWIRRAYVTAARLVSGWSRDAVAAHLMITNSNWTAAQFRRHYPGARIEPIYHGVTTAISAGHEAYLPHELRENTIAIIGRVVPFKRVHLAVQIVDRLRGLGHADLKLLIIGGGGGPYADEIAGLAGSRPYVQWKRDLPRQEMELLIARQRWGLHAAEHEHYGLAPLELQRLGCVTFVHDSGGQVEAVRDAELKYVDVDSAVQQMHRVMSDSARSQALFNELPIIVAEHTADGFRRRFIERMKQEGVLDA